MPHCMVLSRQRIRICKINLSNWQTRLILSFVFLPIGSTHFVYVCSVHNNLRLRSVIRLAFFVVFLTLQKEPKK